MRSYRKELWFNVSGRRAFVNITGEVQSCLREIAISEGLALVSAMHITASVFVNDNESGHCHEYGAWLEELAPHAPIAQYWHHRTGEDSAHEHLKRHVMGREVVVAITGGRLGFGTWERIYQSQAEWPAREPCDEYR